MLLYWQNYRKKSNISKNSNCRCEIFLTNGPLNFLKNSKQIVNKDTPFKISKLKSISVVRGMAHFGTIFKIDSVHLGQPNFQIRILQVLLVDCLGGRSCVYNYVHQDIRHKRNTN